MFYRFSIRYNTTVILNCQLIEQLTFIFRFNTHLYSSLWLKSKAEQTKIIIGLSSTKVESSCYRMVQQAGVKD